MTLRSDCYCSRSRAASGHWRLWLVGSGIRAVRPTCSALELTKASHWRICAAARHCSPGNRPVLSNALGNGKWKLRRHGCSYRMPLLLLGAGGLLSHGLSLQSSSCTTTFMMQRHNKDWHTSWHINESGHKRRADLSSVGWPVRVRWRRSQVACALQEQPLAPMSFCRF